MTRFFSSVYFAPFVDKTRFSDESVILEARDLTLRVYEDLLEAMQQRGHAFLHVSDHLRTPSVEGLMLRHDVDDRKLHSLAFARLQHRRGITGTYYFRMLPVSFNEAVVREVHELGHEVGYHYEEMDLCDGDRKQAWDLFRRNLDRLRAVVPVTSICMHGSPRSRYDNKDLWRSHNYRELGIIGEPYLDVDFQRVAYYTDTGGRWDGAHFSVRDHAPIGPADRYNTTHDMIGALRRGDFPCMAMLTFHPQRWTDSAVLWLRQRVAQTAKNYAKLGMIRWRSLSRA